MSEVTWFSSQQSPSSEEERVAKISRVGLDVAAMDFILPKSEAGPFEFRQVTLVAWVLPNRDLHPAFVLLPGGTRDSMAIESCDAVLRLSLQS